MQGEPIALSWSSGKDSLLTLIQSRVLGYRIETLLTTVRDDDRVSVHGVRRALLRQQADALGIELVEVLVNEERPYAQAYSDTLLDLRKKGIWKVAYGDLFLEDIRSWRDRFHDKLGLRCVYPIWNLDTKILARAIVGGGHKAILTCVDTKALPEHFAGRTYDKSLLEDLPKGVDPCGENGEFHTFVYDSPEFSYPIAFEKGEVAIREFDDPNHKFRFGFCDLKEVEGAGLKR